MTDEQKLSERLSRLTVYNTNLYLL